VTSARREEPLAEELVSVVDAARRLDLSPAELRRRLRAAEVVQIGRFHAELRQSELVALRRGGT
jgi:hypothetical protein